MNQYSDRILENKTQAIGNITVQKQHGSNFALSHLDNRPEGITQRKLQEIVNNSAQVKQLKAYQAMADAVSINANIPVSSSQKEPNHTGLPDNLKSGIENLSGFLMDDVQVHYNSAQPAQLQALAYAQGTQIHIGPGQEKHVPHEAWHVVQQKQGRVQPTLQLKGGVEVNNDEGLEREAEIMGEMAIRDFSGQTKIMQQKKVSASSVAQLYRVGYAPNLIGLDVPGGGGGAYSRETFNRPGGWYEHTLDMLFARAINQGRTQTITVFGRNVSMVQCEVTGVPSNINDMDIGHIQNWADYVAEKVPGNVREATNAYNDMNNLRLESPTVNRSHDFEDGRDSEDEDDDTGSEMDDFIVDRDEEMDPAARAGLDEWIAGIRKPHE